MNAMKASMLSFILAPALTATAAQVPESLPPGAGVVARSMDPAVAAACRNDLAAVQREIAASIALDGTSRASVSTAMRIMSVVHQTTRTGRSDILPQLSALALSHLRAAETQATTVKERASALALTGLLQERFLGDVDGALASYRAAAQMDPEHSEARRASERIGRTLSNLNERLRK